MVFFVLKAKGELHLSNRLRSRFDRRRRLDMGSWRRAEPSAGPARLLSQIDTIFGVGEGSASN